MGGAYTPVHSSASHWSWTKARGVLSRRICRTPIRPLMPREAICFTPRTVGGSGQGLWCAWCPTKHPKTVSWCLLVLCLVQRTHTHVHATVVWSLREPPPRWLLRDLGAERWCPRGVIEESSRIESSCPPLEELRQKCPKIYRSRPVLLR